MDSLMGKVRKPKFELHLKICDLNNVPLVSGNSFIKWHLAHSIHAEHRGRTEKCPISNHRVDYAFYKTVPKISISVDKNNNLSECPMEFEILQEFGATEKITLGVVRLNLSEYIEESEAFVKDNPPAILLGRRRTSSLGISPTSAPRGRKSLEKHADVFDGIVRRYLMQESKINSTLKMSILMVQIDGDRSFVAPPLRTAPTFGGIAGVVASEAVDDEAGPIPSISKPKDAAEIQDLYRRTLAASWSCLPAELPADECIEDIFSGGNGWKTRHDSSNTDTEEENDGFTGQGTLRPSDFRKMGGHRHHHHHHHGGNHHHHHHHRRNQSGGSDMSALTVTGRAKGAKEADGLGIGRRPSLTSLAPTLASDRSRGGGGLPHVAKGVGEEEVREDLVAWLLPEGGLTA